MMLDAGPRPDRVEQRLQKEAAEWGHFHAATLKEDGYIVGLTSKSSIEVIKRLRTAPRYASLSYRRSRFLRRAPFAVQIRHRQREVQLIAQRVERSIAAKRPVLVLGDFNALSPVDRANSDNNPALLQHCERLTRSTTMLRISIKE